MLQDVDESAIDYDLFQSLSRSIQYGRSANEATSSEDSVFGRGEERHRFTGRHMLGSTQTTPIRNIPSHASNTRQEHSSSLGSFGCIGRSQVSQFVQPVYQRGLSTDIPANITGEIDGGFYCHTTGNVHIIIYLLYIVF